MLKIRDSIIDPAAIFAMLFGSELFEEYIGKLAMASIASLDVFMESENVDTKVLQEKLRVKCLMLPSLSLSIESSFYVDTYAKVTKYCLIWNSSSNSYMIIVKDVVRFIGNPINGSLSRD